MWLLQIWSHYTAKCIVCGYLSTPSSKVYNNIFSKLVTLEHLTGDRITSHSNHHFMQQECLLNL